jgi:pimeloyl-ACP methyl ester carboxylesterase
VPKGKNNFPIVIFVHGSGPNDRDETIGPNKPFRDIAHRLAEKGIASLRYDKRTFVYGIQAFSHPDSMDLATEVPDDVRSAIDTLRRVHGISAIFIIGHSLGGMLAPEIAMANPEVAGIIMLAGNARPFAELIVAQTEYLLGADGLQETDEKAMSELREQIEILDKFDSGIDIGDQPLPLKLPKAYWRSVLDYDQLAVMKSVKIPVLILQGERDYQVTMEDFELWKRTTIGMGNVTFQSFPKLNHLFLEGEGPSYPSEYDIESNVPTYVTDTIVNWIIGVN